MIRSKLALLFLSIIFLSSACQKEDTCVADDLASAIIGTWTVTGDKAGTATFMEDGTLIDDNSSLHGLFTDENGLTIEGPFTYRIPDNASLEIDKIEADGTAFPSTKFDIVEFDCEEIKMTFFFYGGEIRLQKE